MDNEILDTSKQNTEISTDTIKETDEKLMSQIVASKTSEDFNVVVKQVQLNQAKKNAIRIMKLNDLVDDATNRAIERVENRPDEIPNKELMEIMKTSNDLINSANKNLNLGELGQVPTVQITQNHNEITINGETKPLPPKESRDKIVELIKNAMAKATKQSTEATAKEQEEIIEGEVMPSEFDKEQ